MQLSFTQKKNVRKSFGKLAETLSSVPQDISAFGYENLYHALCLTRKRIIKAIICEIIAV